MYLPAEDLRRFGCAELPDAAMIRYEADRAGEWFDRGLQLTERARRPQRVLRAGDDRHLPHDPRAHRARPG